MYPIRRLNSKDIAAKLLIISTENRYAIIAWFHRIVEKSMQVTKACPKSAFFSLI